MIDNKELLNYVIQNGIIDVDTIRLQIEMDERKKYLEMHKSKIWEDKKGKWYTYIPDTQSGRKLLKKNSLQELENAIYNYYKQFAVEPTIKEIFYWWLNEKLEYGEIQKQSYDRYETDFERFFINNEKFKLFCNRKIKNIDEEDLEKFLKTTISSMGLTQKSYSGLKTLVNGIFKYAKKKKFTTLSITNFMGDMEMSNRVFKKNIKDKEKEVFFEGETEALTNYLASQKDDIRCQGLLLIFQTGIRVGELCGLKAEDFTNNYIHIRRTEVKYKNDSKKWVYDVKEYPKSEAGDRYVIISEKAVDTLNNIMSIRSKGDFLFSNNGKRIRADAFRRKLERVCNKLDIAYKSNHKIRKTYGTLLIDSGVDESIVAEQMGHKDISTTKKYYYFSNKSEAKKREQIFKAISF